MADLTLTVKYGGSTLELSLPASATVTQLQERLESELGVMVRRQKLMAKGKVISGAKGTLADAGVANGAKLMLLAAAGAVPIQSQVRGRTAGW